MKYKQFPDMMYKLDDLRREQSLSSILVSSEARKVEDGIWFPIGEIFWPLMKLGRKEIYLYGE